MTRRHDGRTTAKSKNDATTTAKKYEEREPTRTPSV